MKTDDLDYETVALGVRAQDSTFHTKDVSTHPDVMLRHGVFEEDGAFNAAVGRFLSKYRRELALELVAEHGKRGATWKKIGVAAFAAPTGTLAAIPAIDHDA